MDDVDPLNNSKIWSFMFGTVFTFIFFLKFDFKSSITHNLPTC